MPALIAFMGTMVCLATSTAAGQSLSSRDLQVLARAATFMLPQPEPDGVLAIVYSAVDAASRQDADAIAALIGNGLQVGRLTLRPVVMEDGALVKHRSAMVIAAAGANAPAIGKVARTTHVLCATADLEVVRAGSCTMAIRSSPRVEILVNHAAAEASGIEFAAAFRMMIREF